MNYTVSYHHLLCCGSLIKELLYLQYFHYSISRIMSAFQTRLQLCRMSDNLWINSGETSRVDSRWDEKKLLPVIWMIVCIQYENYKTVLGKSDAFNEILCWTVYRQWFFCTHLTSGNDPANCPLKKLNTIKLVKFLHHHMVGHYFWGTGHVCEQLVHHRCSSTTGSSTWNPLNTSPAS